MKNVIINKIEKYVFTEAQLKGAWQRLNKGKSFQEISNEQLMFLAKKLLNDASHSELEEYSADSAWRTKKDMEGRTIDDDDNDPSMHIELIDTDQQQNASNAIHIDRMAQLTCPSCDFVFYVDDLSVDLTSLKCPIDGTSVVINQQQVKSVNAKTEDKQ